MPNVQHPFFQTLEWSGLTQARGGHTDYSALA